MHASTCRKVRICTAILGFEPRTFRLTVLMLFQLSYSANSITLSPCLMGVILNLQVCQGWLKDLFSILFHVYSGSPGPTLAAKCHRVRKMCSHTGVQARNLLTTILTLFQLSFLVDTVTLHCSGSLKVQASNP